jgi:hypothetical protein
MTATTPATAVIFSSVFGDAFWFNIGLPFRPFGPTPFSPFRAWRWVVMENDFVPKGQPDAAELICGKTK